MRKKILILIGFILLIYSTSCDKHQHTFSEEWSFDKTSHWKNATCEHKTEKYSLKDHSFINEECECGMLYGLQFSIKSDNTYEISDYNGNKDHIVLPNMFNNLPVTSIGSKSFYNATLKSVTIPEGIVSIEEKAFRMCDKLENVILPNGLMTIENAVFENCTKLTDIDFPNTLVKIGNSAFSYCNSFNDIILPNSVTFLGARCFYRCENLKTIILSNGIKVLEDFLFNHCISLIQITIPNSVNTIKDNVFDDCFNLSEVFIPTSVKKVGKDIFKKCHHVKIYCEYSERPECWNNIEFTTDGRPEEWGDYWDGWGTITWGYSNK